MKIEVTVPAKQYAVELEDQKGEELFQKIVGMIAEEAAGTTTQQKPGGMARRMGKPADLLPALKHRKEAEDHPDPEPDREAAKPGAEEGPEKKPQRRTLRPWGFLFIRCPSCGSERAFYTRNEIEKYRCRNCKQHVDIKAPLRQVFTYCSCGASGRYRTNVTEGRIEIPCISCGELIPCEYDEKRGAFYYIHGGQKAARKAAKEAAQKAPETGDSGSDPDLITTGQNGQK